MYPKKLFMLLCLGLATVGLLFAAGGKEAPKASGQASENLPVPAKHYLVTFSNGDMADTWRWAFVKSMEDWAYKFKNLGPGIEYVWTNSQGDSAKQLMDCETLLAMSPDILIVSPNQDEPLDPVIDMATKAKVPLMVIDRSLVRKPGIGTYFTNVTQNYGIQGLYSGAYIVERLKQLKGSYKGNVVEIQGQIGASPAQDRHVGLHALIKNYPDVKIIATGEGKWAVDLSRHVMEGFLERYKPGEIDVVYCDGDDEALGALQAIKAAGRTELLDNRITGLDGVVDFLKEIRDGVGLTTSETPPFYGPFSIPLAIRYLNGEKNIPLITELPLRVWEGPKGPHLVKGPNAAAILSAHIKFAEDRKLALVPPESGNYDELSLDASKLPGYKDLVAYFESNRRVFPPGMTELQNQ
jgi:ABC-type sugar transport system substrate-binding protein